MLLAESRRACSGSPKSFLDVTPHILHKTPRCTSHRPQHVLIAAVILRLTRVLARGICPIASVPLVTGRLGRMGSFPSRVLKIAHTLGARAEYQSHTRARKPHRRDEGGRFRRCAAICLRIWLRARSHIKLTIECRGLGAARRPCSKQPVLVGDAAALARDSGQGAAAACC